MTQTVRPLLWFAPALPFLPIWLIFAAGLAAAQSNPFAPGWDIDPSGSTIEFGSVKYEDGKKVVETHTFTTFAGTIEENGDVKITVKVDSVNTNNDLRNVRMRFLFFESFKYPDVVVTSKLTPDMSEGLTPGSSKVISLPFDLTVKEVTGRLVAETRITVQDDNRIRVASEKPIIFRVADFGLQENLTKIAETAGGFDIVPMMSLNFELVLVRRAGGSRSSLAALEQTPEQEIVNERAGDFSLEECVGRFEILSETGNIYFASGSARLQPDSDFVLRRIVEIIERCPDLRVQISGHTDSDGPSDYNQSLSEERARSVERYLVERGVDWRRLYTAGFGEARPMRPNDSAFNKSRNRRIEFSLYQ